MHNYLDKILARKKQEVELLKETRTLKTARFSVIAEIKRKSPSVGEIKTIEDPVLLAAKYASGGASAFSVLTDGEGFGGSLRDLRRVAEAFPHMPILRKDFIIDPLQLIETVKCGATAVLLIVSALGERTREMLQMAKAMGLEVLVEVHDKEELKIAIEAGADIIGVNNRNLTTFEIDLKTAEELSPLIPKHVFKIAESGVKTAHDALRMKKAGYNCVLVGEALVRAENPAVLIQEIVR